MKKKPQFSQVSSHKTLTTDKKIAKQFAKLHFLDDTDHGHSERAFLKNPKRLGLSRQIGLKFFEAFGVLLAKLSVSPLPMFSII